MAKTFFRRAWEWLSPERNFSSGTDAFPSPQDLYVWVIAQLIESDRWSHATFEAEGTPECVQVAPEDSDLLLNIPYSLGHDPSRTLIERGVEIPSHWRLHEFDPEVYATFAVPEKDAMRIANAIDGLFLNVYNCDSEYSADVCFE
jgi:hypothetical protein